jgi:3-methyladenine DNA glycosylase/8-oxoguanine DNA glycosylase
MAAVLLGKVASLELIPTTPFDFDSTFHKPDHFTSGDNRWQPGIRWQTWNWKGRPLGVKFVNSGTVNQPRLQVEVFSAESLGGRALSSLEAEFRYRYNLDLDLSAFYRAFHDDPALGPLIQRWRGMRPGHPSSLYEYLIIGITLQNATVRRSIQMFKALLENYGTRLEFDGETLWCMWHPGALTGISEAELRALKLGYRAKSIRRIDDSFAQGLVDELELRRQDRTTQMKALLKLYGVGPATVWYLLFDVFHHWDFLDHISPWEQKIYSRLFFDQDPGSPVAVEDLLKYLERYRLFKQLAVHYFWEDLWWKRKDERIPWLEALIRA